LRFVRNGDPSDTDSTTKAAPKDALWRNPDSDLLSPFNSAASDIQHHHDEHVYPDENTSFSPPIPLPQLSPTQNDQSINYHTPDYATLPTLEPRDIDPDENADLYSYGFVQNPFPNSDIDVLAQTNVVDRGIDSESITSSKASSASPEPLWPFTSEDEAHLMLHFITYLSTWFDYCDEKNHFGTMVPRNAATCSTLLYAIFAVSAKHLSLTNDFDRYASDIYQRKCLEVLIPALNDHDAVLNDNLLAATLILRLLDEMIEPEDARCKNVYALGTHVFVRVREGRTPLTSLRSAAFKVELRQEIVIAFRNRTPVCCSLDDYLQYYSDRYPARCFSNLTEDIAWTWQMITHVAHILTYCYGNGHRGTERWQQLLKFSETWYHKKPISFEPIYEEKLDGPNSHFLPKIWFANDCHVAGHQFYGLCRILLLAHDPRIPQLGPDREDALREVDTQIKNEVRRIAGIAQSNSHFAAAVFTSHPAIAMCGDRFRDRREQEQLHNLIIETEAHLAWPHMRAQEQLRKNWGWDE